MSSIHSIWTGSSRRGRTPRRLLTLFAFPRAVRPGMRTWRRICLAGSAPSAVRCCPYCTFCTHFFGYIAVRCRNQPGKRAASPKTGAEKQKIRPGRRKIRPKGAGKAPEARRQGRSAGLSAPSCTLLPCTGRRETVRKLPAVFPASGMEAEIQDIVSPAERGTRYPGFRTFRRAGAGSGAFPHLFHLPAPGSALCHGPRKSGLRGLSSRTCRGAPAVISRRRRI